jgi:hypothetical protein
MADVSTRELLKKGPPTGESILEQYLKPLEDRLAILSDGIRSVVLDRWHIGELVYGPLLRGKSLLTEQQADYIDMVMQTFGAAFFHVTAPLNILEDRYDMRGDGLIKRDQLAIIMDHYIRIFAARPHWAMCTPSLGQSIPWKQGTRTILPAPRAGQYIGPMRPKVLLLGDKRNDKRFIFPFVPERASSGHWLMGAMHAAKVNHMDVGLMNACEATPLELGTQWEQLGKPPVVCLGRNAERAWRFVGDWTEQDFYLNHPQFERRFHYTSMARYGEAIREVIDGR